jgi:hypothetical protein
MCKMVNKIIDVEQDKKFTLTYFWSPFSSNHTNHHAAFQLHMKAELIRKL